MLQGRLWNPLRVYTSGEEHEESDEARNMHARVRRVEFVCKEQK